MWPLSYAAQTVIPQSHTYTLRARAYGTYGEREIPISRTGSCTSDAGSQVRRQARMETDIGLWDTDPRAILQVTGTEIQIDYGIVLPGRGPTSERTEWIPLIRGVLSRASRQRPIPGSGALPLQLFDRSVRVAQDRFTSPWQTAAGALTTVEIRRIIQRTLGTSVAVTDLTGSTKVAPVLEVERDPWAQGVEVLADSIGAEVFADPQGNFVIRPQPTIADNPVWVVASGARGILVGRDDEMDREEIYNGVCARGERTDGTAPVMATVWDTDPNSPTYYLGPMGRKPRMYSSPLLTTVAQCETAAAALLARVKGRGAKVTMSAIVNPALEGGDVIKLHDEGLVQTHIVDKVEVPFGPDAAQQLAGRSLDLPAEGA